VVDEIYWEKHISPQRHGEHGEVKIFLICRETAADQNHYPLCGKLRIGSGAAGGHK